MIKHQEIWEIIETHLTRGLWISLRQIYRTIEDNWNLDSDDFYPESPTSNVPKWKRNVRNVLQRRKKKNHIQWAGEARYLLPKTLP